MDDAKRFEAEPMSFGEIFLDDAAYVARGHAMEIEYVGNWNADRKVEVVHKYASFISKKPGRSQQSRPGF